MASIEARAAFKDWNRERQRKIREGIIKIAPKPDPGPDVSCPTCGKPCPKLLTFDAGCAECRRADGKRRAREELERIEAAKREWEQQQRKS